MKSHISGIQVPTPARINIDGGLTLDSVAGTSGHMMISQGTGNTPIWSNTLTSPTIVTSLTTSSTSFDLLTTTATTINFGLAATTLNIATNNVTKTINLGTSGTSSTTINIGTRGTSSSIINLQAPTINVGRNTPSAGTGVSAFINGPEVTGTANVTAGHVYITGGGAAHEEVFDVGTVTGGDIYLNAGYSSTTAGTSVKGGVRVGTLTDTGSVSIGRTGITTTINGTATFPGSITSTGDISTGGKLQSTASAGDEGGEIFLNKSATNTTLTGGVTIDVWQNRLRFFEQGGSARGFYIDISTGGNSVGTNLVGGGYTLPTATATALGGIELFSGTTQTTAANAVTTTASRTYGLQLNSDLQGVVNVPWTDTVYTLPTATATALGGIELFSATTQTVAANAVTTQASRTYGLQLNSDLQGVVNVPWTDTLFTGGTLTSNLILTASTTSISSLRLPTGTVPTTGNQQFGMVAADAESLQLATTKTTGAGPGFGFIRAPQMIYAVANSSAATSSTPVSPFAAANDVLSSLEVGKSYRFRGTYYLTSTFTSGSPAIQLVFAFSNAPVIFKYNYKTYRASGQASFDLVGQPSTNAATTVSASVTSSTSYVVEFEGFFTSNATTASTLTPQFQMAAPGVSTVATAGSFFEVEKLGTSSQTLIAGNWA